MPLAVTDPAIEPYSYFVAVTPSDTTVLTGVRALYIGSIGSGASLVVTDQGGEDATFTVAAGQIVAIAPSKVKAATTASGIVALK